jgi:hypothetical protein
VGTSGYEAERTTTGWTLHTLTGMLRPLMVRPLVTTARRVFALALLVSVALAAVFSGRTYIWCVPMQKVVEHACQEEEDEGAEGPSVHACCETHQVAELPHSAPRPELPSLPPTVVALASVPAIVYAPRRWSLIPVREARPMARYGPSRAGPCSSSARCVALQVFRC